MEQQMHAGTPPENESIVKRLQVKERVGGGLSGRMNVEDTQPRSAGYALRSRGGS